MSNLVPLHHTTLLYELCCTPTSMGPYYTLHPTADYAHHDHILLYISHIISHLCPLQWFKLFTTLPHCTYCCYSWFLFKPCYYSTYSRYWHSPSDAAATFVTITTFAIITSDAAILTIDSDRDCTLQCSRHNMLTHTHYRNRSVLFCLF